MPGQELKERGEPNNNGGGDQLRDLPSSVFELEGQEIYKEIEDEFHITCEHSPDLTRWAQQGVLLLNASLSVLAGQANSHESFGWHYFTDAVIHAISEKETADYTAIVVAKGHGNPPAVRRNSKRDRVIRRWRRDLEARFR